MNPAPATPAPTAASREYRTRLVTGFAMALLAAGVLVLDHYLAEALGRPIYPSLFVAVCLLVALSVAELRELLSAHPRPPLWLILTGCLAVALAGWPARLGWTGEPANPWRDTAWVFAGVILAGFSWEMAVFREPSGAVIRLALLTWMVGYVGLLAAFFVQVRFVGVTAMALVIFVPKCGDIGAYFTGRALGRHRMTPLLSPKKTWEGLAGGLALSALVAVGLNVLVAPVIGNDVEAALFGVAVGVAGVLGDLAESLVKRDCQKKDASQVVPGFGGVLDVVDSVLFAAPVAYWWLH